MFQKSLLILLILLPLAGHAYDLRDHKKILLQALQEYNACAAYKIGDWQQAAVLKGDIDEDLNLIRKDLLYSHYYNPHTTLNMFRQDSRYRVMKLQGDLTESSRLANRDELSIYIALGSIVHHLQDMTVPAHVVPVTHTSWTDGFEDYAAPADLSLGLDCAQIEALANGPLPGDLIHEVALQTFSNMTTDTAEVNVHLELGDLLLRASGDDFWQASPYQQFGHYGRLGNHFGETRFTENGVAYVVPEAFYAEFKQRQMRLAVTATVKAFYWFANLNKPVAVPH
jgi:hypothetical protein